jgi:hypothetical protein
MTTPENGAVNPPIKRVVNQPCLLLPKPPQSPQIPDRTPLCETFDAKYDLRSELFPLREDHLVRDDGEFPEGDKEEFLEFGYCPGSGIRGVRVGRVTERGEVVTHETGWQG